MDSTQDPTARPRADAPPGPAPAGGFEPTAPDPIAAGIAELARLDPAEAAGPAAEIADRLSRALDAEGDGR